jgi:hypothetical protein
MDVKSLKRENVTTGTKWTDACARQASARGARGVWRGRWSNQVKPSRTKSNQKFAWQGEGARKSGHRRLRRAQSSRAIPLPKVEMSVQAYDFSPLRTIFHLFHPISQPQGFDFSPVTPNSPEKNVEDRKQGEPAPRRQSLHPIFGEGMFLAKTAKAGGVCPKKSETRHLASYHFNGIVEIRTIKDGKGAY